MSDIKLFFSEVAVLVDDTLDNLLPAAATAPTRLHEAIRWSVFAGGKRFRPALTLAVGRTFGVPDDQIIKTAAATEMIHTFSLIHDDLPAMDDDDLRRGKVTCHKKFDEATAILAGDALQTLAFKAIAEDTALPVELRLYLIAGLAVATGSPHGMVAGQQLDLEAEGKEGEVDIEQIHTLKTGALINFSAEAGAVIGGANESDTEAIRSYSRSLGLLFQITDDLLDISQTSDVLGKTAGKDAVARKATYPSQYGFEASIEMAANVYLRAVDSLSPIDERGDVLRSLARHILERAS